MSAYLLFCMTSTACWRRLGLSFCAAACLAAATACNNKNGPIAPTDQAVQPATPTVTAVNVSGTAPAVGASVQFTATAALSNGTSESITTQAAWSSGNPQAA